MFFGAATDAQSAHRLLSLAAERGVNVFDTAEMYPVPQSAQHQGQSEITLGNWLKTQPRCDPLHPCEKGMGLVPLTAQPLHSPEAKASSHC